MAAQNINAQSVLAADFGSINTRVILVDLVGDQYRLISRSRTNSTLDAPIGDVTIGMGRAIQSIQANTGRGLLDQEGLIFPEQPDGSGFDELIATTSAARPLRAVLIGLVRDVSMASAVRSLNGTYIEIAASVSVSDNLPEEDQLNAILKAQPDLIFITGGTDGGNEEVVKQLVDLVKIALTLLPDNPSPMVLFAGNQNLSDYVYNTLYDEELDNDVLIAPNIRPALNDEELATVRLELAIAYSNFVTGQPGGFRDIAGVSKVGVVPTAQSIGNMMRWLGELPLDGAGVLHLDVGSSTSSLIVAIDGQVSANIQSDMGMGHSLQTAVEKLALHRVQDWLPFHYSISDLKHYAYNKTLAPWTIPQNTQDMLIEYAFAREIIHHLVESEMGSWQHLGIETDVPEFQPIIISGATLTETAHPGITAMLIIDALAFEGFTNIYVDPFSLLPALGAIAMLNPTITVQVFENQALTNLGPAICASGRPRRRGSKPAMQIKITLANGRTIQHNLLPGEIWAAPISAGQVAEVDVRIGRGLNVNGKRRFRKKVTAGAAGIIFDARGRPLDISDIKKRAEVFNLWWTGVSNEALQGWERWAESEVPTKSDEPSYTSRQIDQLQSMIAKEMLKIDDEQEEG